MEAFPPVALDGTGTADVPEARRVLRQGALVVAGAAALLLVVLLGRQALATVVPYGAFLPLHTALELLTAVVGFAVFTIHWHSLVAREWSPRRIFLGAVFLTGAVLDVLHTMTYRGMPGLVEPGNADHAIWYWLAGRYVFVVGLVVATWVPREGPSRWGSRAFLTPLLLLVLGTLVAAEPVLDFHGLFFRVGEGVTPLKTGLEVGLMGLAAVGAALWLVDFRRSGDRAAVSLAVALALTIGSETLFTLYREVNDLENLVGHLYKVAAYYLVFEALFIAAVVRPYRRLDETVRALRRSNRELDGLKAHVEGELAETIARLEEKQEAERRSRERTEDLLRMVSHDLRSPLSAIGLQAQRLGRVLGPAGGPVGPPGERAVAAITRSVRRMSAMIDDLVASERLAVRGLEVVLGPVALRPLLDEVLTHGAAGVDPARIGWAVPEALPPVQADPEALERVLTNLLTNAAKYSPEGSPIEVGAEAAGETVRIWVRDRGRGIAAADLPRVFDRYFRAQGTKRGGGLGLGLFIVKGLMEAQGGRVEVESTLGEGTTFRLVLPAARPEASAAGG